MILFHSKFFLHTPKVMAVAEVAAEAMEAEAPEVTAAEAVVETPVPRHLSWVVWTHPQLTTTLPRRVRLV